MGSIYQSAKRVVVWIGEEDETTGIGLILLSELLAALPVDRVRKIGISDIIAKFGPTVQSSKAWEALRELFTRPWFRRVWVIQEAALAARSTVRCGSYEIPWTDLVDLCQVQAGEGQREYEAHETMLAIEAIRERYNLGLERPLVELLSMSVDFKSTDPRDKLFGLLGVATDAQEPDLLPDYSLSVQDVYAKVTRILVLRDKSLAVLCDARNPKRLAGLPTWTPDWSIPHAVQTPLASRSRRKYMAAGNTEANAYFSKTLRTIFLKGVAVDTISTLGNVLPTDYFSDDIHTQWKRMAQSVQPYPTGEDYETVYWRTLLADSGRNGVESDRYNQTLYETWQNNEVLHTSVPIPNIDVINARRTEFHTIKTRFCTGRRLFTTEKGYLGLGPADARERTLICVLHGGPVPLLLHKNTRHQYYNFIGECFIHGLMNGEALRSDVDVRTFAIR